MKPIFNFFPAPPPVPMPAPRLKSVTLTDLNCADGLVLRVALRRFISERNSGNQLVNVAQAMLSAVENL